LVSSTYTSDEVLESTCFPGTRSDMGSSHV
jgi:hypothetical protein